VIVLRNGTQLTKPPGKGRKCSSRLGTKRGQFRVKRDDAKASAEGAAQKSKGICKTLQELKKSHALSDCTGNVYEEIGCKNQPSGREAKACFRGRTSFTRRPVAKKRCREFSGPKGGAHKARKK